MVVRRTPVGKYPSFTFQSGYIQILPTILTVFPNTKLYIPIWLYSNLPLLTNDKLSFFLYIPIWLYSNKMVMLAGWQQSNFTFQSGYIQMRRAIVKLAINVCFTFQSGYIQMYRTAHKACGICPLHSNLVIFKSIKPTGSFISTSLYIPIWLYSNLYPIIPSIQAILNPIFCLPIYLQLQNNYLVYSLLLLNIHLPLFYNNCRTLYIL